MFGGDGKKIDEIAAEVKRTVIGQDDAVDWLCAFADAACAHAHHQGRRRACLQRRLLACGDRIAQRLDVSFAGLVPESDRTPDGLKTLLSLLSGGESARSPLDLLFYQLESGTRYVSKIVADADGEESEQWFWTASNFVRNGDGLRPAETGGLDPGKMMRWTTT